MYDSFNNSIAEIVVLVIFSVPDDAGDDILPFTAKDWRLIMLGSFDSFNDYSFIRTIYEDTVESSIQTATDKTIFRIEASRPVTIFLCYFCKENEIPDDVRVWHVVERWQTDTRLKPPVIRHMSQYYDPEGDAASKKASDRTALLIKKKEFPAGEINIKCTTISSRSIFLS